MLFAIIQIGENDKFTTGDNILQSFSYSLDEGANASRVSFSVYDPKRTLVDKYLAYIESTGGIDALEQPKDPSETPATSTQAGQTAVDDIPEVKAFLDMIAYAEGTSQYVNGGYNTQFTGRQFTNFADHPRTVIRGSSAAGRYQVLGFVYDDAKRAIGVTDFTPQSQDRIALWLIDRDNALDEVRAGNVSAAIPLLDGTWTSFQVKPQAELEAYYAERLAIYQGATQPNSQAAASVQNAANVQATPNQSQSQQGSQITLELGYQGTIVSAFSFIHQSISYNLFNNSIVEFGGIAASWVMTQRVKTTAYQNITFKQFAEKICAQYNLVLDFTGNLNPRYEYFPQRGQSDYDALLLEAQRLGYRVQCIGRTLKVYDRRATQSEFPEFVVQYGDNLALNFTVSYQAQSDTQGNARSSNPNERSQTGVSKIEIDPNTGSLEIRSPDTQVGTARSEQAVTGSPVPEVRPNTSEGVTQAVSQRENTGLIRALPGTLEVITTPDIFLLTPDSILRTQEISKTLDRVWVIKSVNVQYSTGSGWQSTLNFYSPMKGAVAVPESQPASSSPDSNPEGFIKPCAGVVTSRFRTRDRPNHKGVDIAAAAETPIYASRSGSVTAVVNGCPPLRASDDCGGGYGNRCYINHDGGFQTRYAHLTRCVVSNGQQVRQGELVGYMGNSGASRGVHLHFEIRENGTAINPASKIPELR
jgi:murein DD-endopeptidase MepM/ murein hydrolase activator NlpD